ncbi:hypothetical protein Q4595_30745, partial [Wenyingzhuangia sp. 1_MG-2023]|nr:hypothetical protein [Wenyingzhuangia sp. 1_MG-2023]
VEDILDSYSPGGATPITESVYEAAAYLRGDAMKYGKTTTANSDLCMVWEEQEIAVTGSGSSGSSSSSSGSVDTSLWW